MATGSVQAQLGLGTPEDAHKMAALKEKALDRTALTRDLTGIRQQAILATAAGQLFSLHTTTGMVLWRTRLDVMGLQLLTLQVARLPHSEKEDAEVSPVLCGCAVACVWILDVTD